jgi:acetyl esterase
MKNFNFLEPKTRKFIEELTAKGGKPIYQLSVAEARKLLNNLQSQEKKLSVRIENKKIPGPKEEISITIVRPENSHEALPVIMYFHGGGWILGNLDTHKRLISEIALGAEAAVVFVNYTPSPEAKYPVAIEEAYAATDYIAANGDDFNLDSSRLAVAGDSVGGNMATVVSILSKERGGPSIPYQVLFYPVTDANFTTPSYQQYADGPWLTKAAMEWFWNAYEPDVRERKKVTISPLQATIEQLKGLPSSLIITAENDVLRDEGEAYAHKLIEAGVKVTAVRYLATLHDFVLINPISNSTAARSAIALATTKLKEAFSHRVEPSLT